MSGRFGKYGDIKRKQRLRKKVLEQKPVPKTDRRPKKGRRSRKKQQTPRHPQ